MGFKVLTAEISHETNTFNVHPTSIQAFRDRFLLLGEQAIAARSRNNTELAGLLGRHWFEVAQGDGHRI